MYNGQADVPDSGDLNLWLCRNLRVCTCCSLSTEPHWTGALRMSSEGGGMEGVGEG